MAKKTAERLQELLKNRNSVADSLSAIGADGLRTDGLGTLADKARSAVVVKGAVKNAKVSSAGTVFQGDRIKRAKEFSAGVQIRFAVENTTVIAAQRLRENCLVVVFAQDGDTYIKALQFQPGAWTLGNTLLILEGDVPLSVSIVPLGDTSVAVLYSSDAAGVLAKVSFSGLTATLVYSDIFDVYDPVNIAADTYPGANGSLPVVVASFVRHSPDFNGKAYLLAMRVGDASLTVGEAVELAVTEVKKNKDGTITEKLVELNYSRDEYARAWGLAVFGSTIYLSFFRGYGEERGLFVAGLEGELKIVCKRVADCALAGSLPTVAMCRVAGAYPGGSIALAHGITRVQNNAVKSLLGVEMWHGPQDTDRVLPLCFGEEDVTYRVNIGRVCLCMLDKETLAVGYSMNDNMRAMAIDINGFHSLGGPGQQVCSFNSYAEIVSLNATTAAVVFQNAGSGFAKVLNLQNVVFSTTDDDNDGVAKTGGGSGSTIQIYEAE